MVLPSILSDSTLLRYFRAAVLVPYKGTIFHVKGLSGYSIEFKLDAAGRVTEAIVEQPFGVVTATKKAAS